MYTEVIDNTPIPYEELRRKTLEENVVRLAEAFRDKDGETAKPLEHYMKSAHRFVYAARQVLETRETETQTQRIEFTEDDDYEPEGEEDATEDDEQDNLQNSPAKVI